MKETLKFMFILYHQRAVHIECYVISHEYENKKVLERFRGYFKSDQPNRSITFLEFLGIGKLLSAFLPNHISKDIGRRKCSQNHWTLDKCLRFRYNKQRVCLQ